MRALAVFEKFVEQSDPIEDMGVGILNHLKRGSIIHCIKFIQFSGVWAPGGRIVHNGEAIYTKPKQNWLGNRFEDGERYCLVKDTEQRRDGKIEICARNVKYGNGSNRLVLTPRKFFKHFSIIKSIDEKFIEQSDPI